MHVIVHNLQNVMPSDPSTVLPCASIADPTSVDYRTSPIHLRAMAYLYGLETAEVEQARVLELGCDAGLNLLPFALAHPHAQIVGVDINPEHVDYGQEKIRELGASNYQLFAVDLASLLQAPELGSFDYIIVRGVFSMTDAETRLEILRFCQRHLSSDGIACFDYPTYPGAATDDMLRDAMLFHSSLADDEHQKLDSARAMLAFMEQGVSSKNPFKAGLARQLSQVGAQSDLKLGLKYLQDLHRPCHFIEFHDLANQSQLVYVGDASPYTELPESWGTQTHTLCATINPSGNKALGQQYLDFACGRSSRLSIVARQDKAAEILPGPDLKRLKDLRWAGYFERYQNDQGHEGNGHWLADGTPIATDNQLALSVLDNLGYAWPCSLDFDTLLFNTMPVASLDPEAKEHHPEQLERSLHAIFMYLGEYVRFSRSPTPYDGAQNKHVAPVPGIWQVVPSDQSGDSSEVRLFTSNFWQDRVVLTLSPAEQALLAEFDGESGPGQWSRAFASDSGDEAEVHEGGPDTVIRLAVTLKKHGLLHGSSKAWLELHSAALQGEIAQPEKAALHVAPLMMHTFSKKLGGIGRVERLSAPQINSKLDVALHQKVVEIHRLLDNLDFEKAYRLSRSLVRNHEASAIAWYELHRTLLVSRRFKEMLEPALQSVLRDTGSSVSYNAVALSLRYREKHWLHRHLLEKVLRIDPLMANAWDHLNNYYAERQQIQMSTLCSEQAAKLAPENEDILSNLAGNYSNQMRVKEALDIYAKIIKLNKNKLTLYSNYLFVSLHSIDLSPEEVYRLHREYGQVVEKRAGGAHLKRVHKNDKHVDRPLRIGFVSGDLRNHAVAHFLEPFWTKLDRRQFSLFAYQAHTVFDVVSERLRALATEWRDISGMTDEAAASLVREDRIDVLIDLSGHTAHNRLPMFAFKPAPVQMTWIGYPGTTGLEAMDYKLVAECSAFGNLQAQFTENLVLVPNRVLFRPDPSAPEVSELPMLKNQYITYGSFNRAQKFSDRVLSTWAEILSRVPNSRLIMANMSDQGMVEQFRNRFKKLGFGEDRVTFRRRMSMDAYQKLHHEVDVLLDTFPYNGGTTTAHGLWMGVPTLTLAGETLACRHGVPLLTQYDLTDFIAYSVEEYIEKAVTLATRSQQLSELRQSMRDRIEAVPVTVEAHVKGFERVLREVWRRWCAGEQARSFSID